MTELLALIEKIVTAGHSIVMAPGHNGNVMVGLRVNSDNRHVIQGGMSPAVLANPGALTWHLESLYESLRPRDEVRAADGRVVREAERVVLEDGCVDGHHPDLVSCSLGAEWP